MKQKETWASWTVCTFNREEDKDYWIKGPPCEYSDDDCLFYYSKELAYNIIRKEARKMETIVYTLEDFRDDYNHGVIGAYSSFKKVKKGLISVLKESIASYKDELDECEDELDEYTKVLRDSIAELKESIKNVQKAIPNLSIVIIDINCITREQTD